jgi:predicted aminopeptidase
LIRAALIGLVGLLAGCASAPSAAPDVRDIDTEGASLGFYWQALSGHVELLRAAKPVDDWLGSARTPQRLKDRLKLAQNVRQFAIDSLKLPAGPSYTRYADLQRPAVVWNVVAAPEFSLQPKSWCFVLAGCVTYRGYFAQADAQAFAKALQTRGYEVIVSAIPAYSTLGKLDWIGGDPLLSTFIQWNDADLARLIIHEMAHQVVYVKDDTMFNESFATAVERMGGAQWLAQMGSVQGGNAQAQAAFAQRDERAQAFRALAARTRDRLKAVYTGSESSFEANFEEKQALAGVPSRFIATKREAKQEALDAFRAEYAHLKASWGGWTGYDAWVAGANNARFASLAAYDELVPAFIALYEREGRDWPRFYAAVQQLAVLPKSQRRATLDALNKK